MVMMQGILWKWTNYLSGWQPRWFVLDYGVLAYYRSQEEVHLGSRGSLKMSCCEIHVNASDALRIDLKIPPENFMYLKASTAAERQQWVVALGTAKACLVDSNYEEQQQQLNSMKFLRERMKELNMCRNIILEQVHTIKTLSVHQDQGNQPLVESATLLSATCDTFLSNLSDVMEIVEDNLSTMSGSPVSTPVRVAKAHHTYKKPPHKDRFAAPPLSPSSFTDSLVDMTDNERHLGYSSPAGDSSSPTGGAGKTLAVAGLKTDRGMPDKVAALTNAALGDLRQDVQRPALSPLPELSPSDSSVSSASPIASSDAGSPGFTGVVAEEQIARSVESPAVTQAPRRSPGVSFFGRAMTRFEDIEVVGDNLIPTKTFLSACSCIIPVFDSLNSTAFTPVKMDIDGNIKKLQAKHATDEKAFAYLQNIIFQEVNSNTCTARNSATDALLWLKRALTFIQCLLAEVVRGEPDLAVAAGTAYGKSLRKYHGWMVRGVFALAMKACPYREDFIAALAKSSDGVAATEEVIAEMAACADALGRLVNILNAFYRRHKLDSDAVV